MQVSPSTVLRMLCSVFITRPLPRALRWSLKAAKRRAIFECIHHKKKTKKTATKDLQRISTASRAKDCKWGVYVSQQKDREKEWILGWSHSLMNSMRRSASACLRPYQGNILHTVEFRAPKRSKPGKKALTAAPATGWQCATTQQCSTIKQVR